VATCAGYCGTVLPNYLEITGLEVAKVSANNKHVGSLREEGMGEFDGESAFAYLLRVGCG
jgi:hypothetical protein